MHKCLCCGNETLPVPAEEAIAYICPVCWWENDVFLKSPHEPSDENHGMTLLEAHENYIKYGICDISPRLHRCTWKATFPQADALLGDRAPFLSVLEESPDNELHIRINAAFIGEMEPEMLDGLDQPVVSVVAKCRPIQPSSRVIDIRFQNYIMYQVRNESFCHFEPKSIRNGNYLATYEQSKLLEYLSVATDVQQGDDGSFYPAPWVHYSIFTQNQVIDIISHCDPVLTVGTEDTL